ncbi:hypothetical protein C2G38_2226310 [Gigaspora rosea]|uniref:Uncharacterized protein n=1 Tax=Gigaspora rosea TaxID=44941 RepID=A0A397TYA6_9GLOM|nr:hypothetical protein C2G38_2226310 [Gigaspora rosea]
MFIEKIKTISLKAKLYSEKLYNYCEKYKNYINGLFEFGKFCEIEKYTKILLRSKKYKNKEYEAIVEKNKLLVNATKLPEEAYNFSLIEDDNKCNYKQFDR